MQRLFGTIALVAASACASAPASVVADPGSPAPALEVTINASERATLFASAGDPARRDDAVSAFPLFKLCSAADSRMPLDIVMSPDKGALGDQHPLVRHETLAPGQCILASAADIEARAPVGADKANAWLAERISALQAELPSAQRDEKLRFFGNAAQPVFARITVEPVLR